MLQDIFDHSILGTQSLIEWFQLLTNGQWIALGLIIFTKPSRKASPFRAGMDRQEIRNLI